MHYFALVSNAEDGDIAVFHLDGTNGALAPVARYATAPKVMPLALSADHRHVTAGTRGKQPSLMTFSIDAATGKLTHRDTVTTQSSKAYLSGDKGGRFLFGASYGEHILSVYAPSKQVPPLQVIEGIRHAHCVIVSPDDKFAYVTSLGSDRVFSFEIQAPSVEQENVEAPQAQAQAQTVTNGKTHVDTPLKSLGSIALDAGFGPRHMRFSPSGKYLYVLSELRGRIAVLARDPENGTLAAVHTSERHSALSHLHDGAARPSAPAAPVQPDANKLAPSIWAAEIQVHPSGRFIYASERTTSQILIYGVSDDGRSVHAVSAVPTEQQPRGFNIDPSGTFLVACGEKSSQISAYRIDPATGALTQTARAPGGWGANWVEIIKQDAPENTAASPLA